MTWLTAIPWRYIGIAIALVGLLWFAKHQLNEAEERGYARAVEESKTALIEAQRKVLAAERREREAADHARIQANEELAMLAADAAARAPSVIRVCVSAPGDLTLSGAATDPRGAETGTPGAGALHETDARDSVAILDTGPLYELAGQCDALVAKYRGVEEWDGKRF